MYLQNCQGDSVERVIARLFNFQNVLLKIDFFSVPTLIKWGTKQRLQEEQLFDENMVKMMLED